MQNANTTLSGAFVGKFTTTDLRKKFLPQYFAVHLRRRRRFLVYVIAVEVQKIGGAAKWISHIYLLLNTSRLSRGKALSLLYSANSRPVQILMIQFEGVF